jgi:class 3 adenylate cyclase
LEFLREALMGSVQSKRFDEPDETVALPKLRGQIVLLGESYVGRYVHQPGWRWSVDVKPTAGTPSCQFHHQGILLSGRLLVTTDDGAQRTIGPGEAYDIPPGHDAMVLGDEACQCIEFRGVRGWGRAPLAGERVLATLLVTDIVDSTLTAAQLGDAVWKELLARHFERVRLELDRFRGYEVGSRGDGLMAMFDGAARAIRCAAAICRSVRADDIEVRVGVHTGEVERRLDGLQGVAVHEAARVASAAGRGEVLVSASTASLLEGAGLALSDAGEYELKGLAGERRLYRLTEDASPLTL